MRLPTEGPSAKRLGPTLRHGAARRRVALGARPAQNSAQA